MDKKSIILVVSLFALIVAGMFIFAYMKRAEIVQPIAPVVEEVAVPYPQITRITAKQFIIDGEHTFVGELELPTPCDLLQVTSAVQESYPEQIVLDFAIINNAEMCAQVVTTQRFMVTATASRPCALALN